MNTTKDLGVSYKLKKIMLGILGFFLCSLGFVVGYIIICEIPSGRNEWLSLVVKSLIFAVIISLYDYTKMVIKRKRALNNQ